MTNTTTPDQNGATADSHGHRTGVLMALFAMFLFALNDFSWKYAQAEGASFIFVVMMTMLVTVVGVPIYAICKKKTLLPRNKRFQLLYACVWAAELCLFSYALGKMPMVELFIIILTTPLVTAFAAYLFLGESLKRNQAVALVVAFISITIMLIWKETQPLSFGAAPLIAYVAAFTSLVGNTAKQLLLRGFRDHDDTYMTLFWGSFAFVLFALITGAASEFEVVAPSVTGLLLACGVLGGGGALIFMMSFRHAPASIISPTQYSQLFWVALLTGVLFGEPLTLPSVFGMIAISVSGYIFYAGNRQLGKKHLFFLKRP